MTQKDSPKNSPQESSARARSKAKEDDEIAELLKLPIKQRIAKAYELARQRLSRHIPQYSAFASKKERALGMDAKKSMTMQGKKRESVNQTKTEKYRERFYGNKRVLTLHEYCEAERRQCVKGKMQGKRPQSSSPFFKSGVKRGLLNHYCWKEFPEGIRTKGMEPTHPGPGAYTSELFFLGA